jgi:hypothetical protein
MQLLFMTPSMFYPTECFHFLPLFLLEWSPYLSLTMFQLVQMFSVAFSYFLCFNILLFALVVSPLL